MIDSNCHWVYHDPGSIPFGGEFCGPQGGGEYLQKFGSSLEMIGFEPEFTFKNDTVIIHAKEHNRCCHDSAV